MTAGRSGAHARRGAHARHGSTHARKVSGREGCTARVSIFDVCELQSRSLSATHPVRKSTSRHSDDGDEPEDADVKFMARRYWSETRKCCDSGCGKRRGVKVGKLQCFFCPLGARLSCQYIYLFIIFVKPKCLLIMHFIKTFRSFHNFSCIEMLFFFHRDTDRTLFISPRS